MICILDKELEDSGWWKGEVNGKVGVFPDNFVEIQQIETPKPKKPPPPSVGGSSGSTTSSKAQNKPDRPEPAPTENTKKKEDLPSGPPPAIPFKKPPPVSKKPLPARPFEPASKSQAQTDDQKAKAVSHDKKESSNHFDGLESNTEKLSHPTANRAKLPNRRPPSQVFLHTEEEKSESKEHDKHKLSIIHKEEKEEKRDENVKDDIKKRLPTINSTHGPSMTSTSAKRNSYLATASKPEDSPSKLPGKLTSGPVHSGLHSSSSHSSHASASSAGGSQSGASSAVVEDLQREIRELKANTVSKAAYNDLKSEFDKLRKEVEAMKSSFGKKFVDLMNEVDEEKKTRLNTQVEIDRIKRLVTDSSI